MKKSSVMMIAAMLMLSSCGTLTRLASSSEGQQFQDGIYSSSPDFRSKAEKAESKAETEALIAKTKESPVYLFGDKKDTIMIPDDFAATIRYDNQLNSTVVTISENPYDWRNNINPWSYYTPYSIGSSWYWSRHYDHWYWNSWAYTPWRYHGWYDPFYIGGWYDPWYYGGWYDPWYYSGYWGHGWYGYPHYCGWYGGWDPYWGHHHHHHYPGYGPGHIGNGGRDRWYGPRHETVGDERVFTSRTATRRGIGTSSSTSRSSSTGARPVSGSSTVRKVATNRAGASSVTAGKVQGTGKPSAGSGTGTTYRRPSSGNSSASMRDGSSTAVRSSSSSSYDRSSTVSRSSSNYDRNSSGSSYNRSTSTRSSGSSYSGGNGGGSYSRGSSGGGGYSRGGSSSGGRR